MMPRAFLAAALASAMAVTTPAMAAGKDSYALFSPTPADQMREMSTDRPDLTESPYTVDAGHFQVEMDIWNTTIDSEHVGGQKIRTTDTAIAPVNLKAGLTNNIDLQVIIEPYLHSRTRNVTTGTTVDNVDGFGDITARLKINIWGNDGGDTAFAVMPFVKFPTNINGLGNNKVEGGLILPYTVKLTEGIDLAVMTEADVLRNSLDTAYSVTFVNSASVGYDLTAHLGAYTEVATEKSTENGSQWVVTFDTGLTYALTEAIQLDAGVNVGLTHAAPDVNPFIGISWRF